MREAPPVLARHQPDQVTLDLDRVLVPRQPQSLRQPPHVRVDDDPLRIAQLGGDDVRGLPRDSGKPNQLLELSGHLAVELLEQHLHRPPQRLRLLAEEAGREDVSLELLRRDGQVVLGTAVLLKERLGDAVDVHVRRLRRQHHGDEKLELGARPERDRSVGVRGCESLDDRLDACALRPDAVARLVEVTTRRQTSLRRPRNGAADRHTRRRARDSRHR